VEEGDAVVHIHHGIGLYRGMRLLPDEHNDIVQETIVLEFAEGGLLYVPFDQAHLISRYIGAGKRVPRLDVLGGSRWERARLQAERAVFDYAAKLLRVQAERESLDGFAFPPDTNWQKEFEQAFLYEPTPDQEGAVKDIKADMEQNRPMDRLLCGDVGFGKTEVAVRAAFKAVMAGKQVAFLTPTTVLAQQHFQTLCERMGDYPARVELLSRFRSEREQNAVVRKLAAGEVDIVVGTHRLMSRDVKFKSLGLVVIDEEQRFGVKQKELFKERFRQVDVLTLSATPIPRTLYLALMGARDMSTLETPPRDRVPVETVVAARDERLIRAAIQHELDRGGQVFYLHNRVRTIEHAADRVRFLLPGARVETGHGQMDEKRLEEVMARFVAGKTDVLVSTTIIESGIDIPNANTIIIDRADRFGLADLYQLRGRVGRGRTRARALLLLPRELISGDAGKRVRAIRQYTQLGAGFKVAMRDLEIRGAGNLLGTAQSGHIAAVGFDLYCSLLKTAVARTKGQAPRPIPSVRMDLDFLRLGESETTDGAATACIPVEYMQDPQWRIAAYRELGRVSSVEDLRELIKRWRDKFGPPPREALLLIGYNRVKIEAASRGFTKVETKQDKLVMFRYHDYVMVGGKLPRLQSRVPEEKLMEIEQWVLALGKS
jgi:transcription-repair coupling factor (superfamily II helicase)